MIEDPTAVLGEMGIEQLIAFVSFAGFTIGFFVWVAILWLRKH